MIVCHCNCINASEIREAASAMACGGRMAAPSPEQVYGALGLQPCCGGCLPLAESVIAECLGADAAISEGYYLPQLAAEQAATSDETVASADEVACGSCRIRLASAASKAVSAFAIVGRLDARVGDSCTVNLAT